MIIDATSLVTKPEGRKPQDPALVIGFAIHHTVGVNNVQSESDERMTIRAIDQQHVAQNFGGFGYHYIVFPSGRAYKCGEGQRAHVAGRNHELRGIVMSGTYTSQQPSLAAQNGLREVLWKEFEIFYKSYEIRGHREWALSGEGTVCPGMIVPKDWNAFMNQAPVEPSTDGWVVSHNQILAMQDGLVVMAIGDWEGVYPGRIAKLFGDQWWWLRKGEAGNAYWSQEAGD